MERRDYLELMTGQIRCKKMCPVIAKEVEDHIEDQKQVFMAEGMKEEEAEKAQAAAKALFSQGAAADMPTTELTSEDLTDGSIDILSILVKSGLVPSRAEARRAVQQGGVTVEGEKVGDIKTSYTADTLGEGLVVKKGKKNFRKVVMK